MQNLCTREIDIGVKVLVGPSGEKATELAQPERLQNRSRRGVPEPHCVVARPGAACLLSGEKVTGLTKPEWPSSFCTAALVTESRSRRKR